MRLAFVSIPRYPSAVEVQRQPALAGVHLIVGDADQPKRVFDCSANAARLGVCQGMPIRKALGLCSDAVVVPPDPVAYRSAWETILAAMDAISPEVEDEDLGRAYLNVAGLQALHRDESSLAERIRETVGAVSGLQASVGIASSKFSARAAAQGPPGQLVAGGTEADFLAPFTVEFLPISTEAISRLHLLGLDRIGEVQPLTIAELESQFGGEGQRLWQLVHGIDEEPLQPRPRSETLTASLSFEAAVAGIDVLVAASRQLLSNLRPALRGRAARQMVLEAELASGPGWERRIVMHEAVTPKQRRLFFADG